MREKYVKGYFALSRLLISDFLGPRSWVLRPGSLFYTIPLKCAFQIISKYFQKNSLTLLESNRFRKETEQRWRSNPLIHNVRKWSDSL